MYSSFWPRIADVATLPALLFMQGCPSVSADVAVTGSSNGTVSTTVTIHVKPTHEIVGLELADFQAAPASGYEIIVNAPTSNYRLDASGTPQATLTATTDQNYSSSIVVNLQPVLSSTSPVSSGYTVYTFAVPNTSQVQAWTQQVSEHVTSVLSLSSNVDTIITDLGNPGTYTFYAQVDSEQTGIVNSGSATYVHPHGVVGCVGHVCPPQS